METGDAHLESEALVDDEYHISVPWDSELIARLQHHIPCCRIYGSPFPDRLPRHFVILVDAHAIVSGARPVTGICVPSFPIKSGVVSIYAVYGMASGGGREGWSVNKV